VLRPCSAWIVRSRAIACASCLLVAVGCGELDDAPDQERSLHGLVRDAVSGKGLKGVTIAFQSDTLDEADDKTDEEGDYRLLVSTDSLHARIEAKKSGYETRIVSVYFDREDVQIDIDLNPN
jgi:hypothetical protein